MKAKAYVSLKKYKKPLFRMKNYIPMTVQTFIRWLN